MMNNLRRCVVPTLRNGSHALSKRAGAVMATPLSSSSSSSARIGPATRTTRFASLGQQASLYHNGRVLQNNAEDNNKQQEVEVFLTEEMITAMEYHYEQRDVTDLNLFLKHPSSPKMMTWHPDLIFDGEDSILKEDEQAIEEDALPVEGGTEAMSIDDEPFTRPRSKLSFLNRNARYGTKASKGKRPCSRQARRRKKRAIGNHRR